ncbi:MAG TPA: NYN domain-containing protein [Steroidobacteraceae bacterium]|nr:NYN domain-containing protein [Steroidobacteraceae bacterium]
MENNRNNNSDATMAVFLDLENLAIGAREAGYSGFDIKKVLERLLLKGHIVVKKAYCDFDRYKDFKRGLHEAAFELIEIPHIKLSGKNSADIRMVVDALDLCYTKGHVDTFVIISGDSDFSPLVSKLRENAKTVIGVGVKSSTSDLFINNCDEFIYYDDLARKEPTKTRRRPEPAAAAASPAPSATAAATTPATAATATTPAATPAASKPSNKGPDPTKAMDQLMETLDAMTEEREDDDVIWSSVLKKAIKRRNPGFNERAHGFRSFTELLEDAQKRGLLKLTMVENSGNYAVKMMDKAALRGS